MIGIVVGVLLMVIGSVIVFMWKQKKGCFKGRPGSASNQTMPIGKKQVPKANAGSDLEFAGQTLDQKRKSIKAMSKIVEVDESHDLEDYKKHRKVNEVVESKHNVLESMVSVNQVTDTDEQAAEKKKRSS